MNTPETGYNAVYMPSPTAPAVGASGCPGGTGCQQGTDSGFTALPQVSGAIPPSVSLQGTPWNQPMAVTPENLQYLNGFIRTQIGRKVRVEFLVGANTMTDRIGILVGVGANYILLNEIETDDLLACDFYNIKFIRFYY